MNCGIRVRLREQPEGLRKDLARIGDLFGQGLERFGGPFLAGRELSAVDAFYCPVAFRVQTYGLELPKEAAAYVKRLLALRGMQRWYEEALREPYRDPPHEAELAQVGTVTQDSRVPTSATA
jgi:glutathione S-transferase